MTGSRFHSAHFRDSVLGWVTQEGSPSLTGQGCVYEKLAFTEHRDICDGPWAGGSLHSHGRGMTPGPGLSWEQAWQLLLLP